VHNDDKIIGAKGIVEAFGSPTQLFDRLLRRLAPFRPALFEQALLTFARIGSLNEIFWHLPAPLYRNFWPTLLADRAVSTGPFPLRLGVRNEKRSARAREGGRARRATALPDR